MKWLDDLTAVPWPVTIAIVLPILVLGLALWNVSHRLSRLEQDTWTVLPVLVRSSCIMDETRQEVRGRFVVASPTRPGHCFVAPPGGHPKRYVVGILLDDTVVAGQAASMLRPKEKP